jgi:hypothetical protein
MVILSDVILFALYLGIGSNVDLLTGEGDPPAPIDVTAINIAVNETRNG